MLSVLFILFALVGVSSQSKGCRVQVTEDGENFNEVVKIKMTKFGKAVVTDVPKHKKGKLAPVRHIVYDKLDMEIDILKEFGPKKTPICLVLRRTLDEPSENAIEEAMKHGGCGKLPSRGSRTDYAYVIKACEMKEFTEGQMEVAEKECGEIQMLCGENVPLNNVEEEERKAVQIAVDHMKNGDERKRAVVREFNACNPESTMTIMECQPQNLIAHCNIKTEFCTYGLTCPLDLNNGYWSCEYNHKFSQLKCCDYACKN